MDPRIPRGLSGHRPVRCRRPHRSAASWSSAGAVGRPSMSCSWVRCPTAWPTGRTCPCSSSPDQRTATAGNGRRGSPSRHGPPPIGTCRWRALGEPWTRQSCSTPSNETVEDREEGTGDQRDGACGADQGEDLMALGDRVDGGAVQDHGAQRGEQDHGGHRTTGDRPSAGWRVTMHASKRASGSSTPATAFACPSVRSRDLHASAVSGACSRPVESARDVGFGGERHTWESRPWARSPASAGPWAWKRGARIDDGRRRGRGARRTDASRRAQDHVRLRVNDAPLVVGGGVHHHLGQRVAAGGSSPRASRSRPGGSCRTRRRPVAGSSLSAPRTRM